MSVDRFSQTDSDGQDSNNHAGDGGCKDGSDDIDASIDQNDIRKSDNITPITIRMIIQININTNNDNDNDNNNAHRLYIVKRKMLQDARKIFKSDERQNLLLELA